MNWLLLASVVLVPVVIWGRFFVIVYEKMTIQHHQVRYAPKTLDLFIKSVIT